MQRHENKSPFQTEVRKGQNGGGRSPRALSRCNIWHQPKQVDCSPTLFSVTCGVVGLIAGPFKVLRHMNFRVRFICPLSQWLRPLTCGPGWDTPVLHSHPSPLAAGRPSLVTMRWPVPRSRLLSLRLPFHILCSAAVFAASPRFRIVFTAIVFGTWLSRREPGFCSPFGGFRPADCFQSIYGFRRADVTVSNQHLIQATAFGSDSKQIQTSHSNLNPDGSGLASPAAYCSGTRRHRVLLPVEPASLGQLLPGLLHPSPRSLCHFAIGNARTSPGTR